MRCVAFSLFFFSWLSQRVLSISRSCSALSPTFFSTTRFSLSSLLEPLVANSAQAECIVAGKGMLS